MLGLEGDDLDIEHARQGVDGAVFSKDRLYRYRLWRTLQPNGSRVLFIMQNPSKAGAVESDMTIKKCLGFAERSGAGMIDVVNLYAFIATDPKDLWRAKDPIGPRNDEALRYSLNRCAFNPNAVVCAAWGAADEEDERVKHVLRLASGCGIRQIMCLGETENGSPRHPSRIGYDRTFRLWRQL